VISIFYILNCNLSLATGFVISKLVYGILTVKGICVYSESL
jgi:hypothetical protein